MLGRTVVFVAGLSAPALATAAPAARLSDIAWLQGSWEGDGIEGGKTETLVFRFRRKG